MSICTWLLVHQTVCILCKSFQTLAQLSWLCCCQTQIFKYIMHFTIKSNLSKFINVKTVTIHLSVESWPSKLTFWKGLKVFNLCSLCYLSTVVVSMGEIGNWTGWSNICSRFRRLVPQHSALKLKKKQNRLKGWNQHLYFFEQIQYRDLGNRIEPVKLDIEPCLYGCFGNEKSSFSKSYNGAFWDVSQLLSSLPKHP